jgi:hypothetical protein
MSDTPRTDAAAIGFARILIDHDKQTTTELVEANFARQLERELAACRAEVATPKLTVKIAAVLDGLDLRGADEEDYEYLLEKYADTWASLMQAMRGDMNRS